MPLIRLPSVAAQLEVRIGVVVAFVSRLLLVCGAFREGRSREDSADSGEHQKRSHQNSPDTHTSVRQPNPLLHLIIAENIATRTKS
jgi:hypothetical protein